MPNMLSAIWLACLVWLGPRPAAPTPANTVAVAVADAQTDPIARGLAAELSSIGFNVEFVPVPANADDWRELQSQLRARGYGAAIWAVADADELTIWVVDRMTGKALVRSIALPPAAVAQREQLAVLQGIELLRASLRELESRKKPVTAEVPPPRAATRLSRGPRSRVFLELGGSILGASGGIGPSGHIALGFRYNSRVRVGGAVLALAPTVGRQVQAPEGEARVSVAQIAVGPHVQLRRPDVDVAPDLSILAGLNVIRVDGRPNAPYIGRTDHVLGFLLRGGAGLSVHVAPRFALRFDAAAGLITPRATVFFADRAVATWGHAFGLGTAGFIVGLD